MRQTIRGRREEIALSAAAIDRISAWTVEALEQAGTDKKEQIRLRLAVEELLGFWLRRLGPETRCSFRAGTRLRRHYIEIRVAGEKLTPADMLEEEGEYGEYGEYLYSNLLSQTMLAPVYDYRDGVNRVTINPPKRAAMDQFSQMFLAIAAAVLLGAAAKQLPVGVQAAVDGTLTPLFDTLVGGLGLISSPMLFLTICWGVFSIGDIATLGRIGRVVMGRMAAVTAAIVTAACAVLMVSGLFPLDASFQMDGAGAPAQIYALLLAVVPKDIMTPFQQGDALQLIFLGVCAGLALLVLGDKASAVADLVNQLNGLVDFLMGAVGKLIPAFVFLSIFSTITTESFGEMGGAVKCILLGTAGNFLCFFLYAAAVCARQKISLALMLKKLFPDFIKGISTASSAFASNHESCREQLGIARSICNFAIPLGRVIFMPGTAIGFLVTTLCMAENGGVAITVPWLLINILVCSLISMAAPPIPGGTMTCCTILFAQMGLPEELLPLAIGVNLLLEFPMTAVNLTCLQSELVLASAQLGMLDGERLRSANPQKTGPL